MQIVDGWRGVAPGLRGASVAIGNFDGVHKGHQAVLDAARAAGGERGAPLGAAVFDPHPRRFFKPDAPPFRLMTDRVRAETLAGLGVERLYVLPFNAEFSHLGAEAFARDVLVGGLGVVHVAVGANFCFGHDREGDADRLAELGRGLGFGVTAVAPVGDGAAYSSTAARQALREGDCARAEAILGRPWMVDAVVERGLALGRELGFPTINLSLGEQLRPRLGVYAVRVRVDGEGVWRPGAANMGVRPVLGEGLADVLEVHLLDFSGDLYDRRVEVTFHGFLRDERNFDGLDALKVQMALDVEDVRAALAD